MKLETRSDFSMAVKKGLTFLWERTGDLKIDWIKAENEDYKLNWELNQVMWQ